MHQSFTHTVSLTYLMIYQSVSISLSQSSTLVLLS